MEQIKRLEIPEFNTRKELFSFIVGNLPKLMAQKKAIMKYADGISFMPMPQEQVNIIKTLDGKLAKEITEQTNAIKVTAVINTTNLLDSHGDVHIPGLWKKSLDENKMIMHVQEHKIYNFDKIISEGQDLTAFAQDYTWSELGFPKYAGTTQALVFDSNVKKDRNDFMFNQYAKGYVKNHSVGMRYVRYVVCINDEDYGAQYEAWEKYLPMVANREAAEKQGWFWAITEAKIIEGSAVPLGSNFITPTINVEAAKSTSTKQKSQAEKSPDSHINYFLNL